MLVLNWTFQLLSNNAGKPNTQAIELKLKFVSQLVKNRIDLKKNYTYKTISKCFVICEDPNVGLFTHKH